MSGVRPLNKTEEWLFGQWADKLSQAIASMTGEAPKTAISQEFAEDAAGEGTLWWEQPFSGSPDAKLWVGAPLQTWNTIGNEVLKSAGIDDGDDDSIRSTYLEILSQSLSGLGQSISARLRREVTCTRGAEVPVVSDYHAAAHIEMSGISVVLLVSCSAALADLSNPPATERPAVAAASTPAVDHASEPSADGRAYPKGLDLLLDVELPVSVSFGRAELPIKDVIKLSTGSIIELNRSITEPVEVIVNNVVIARGEVVVVEGNFGVRIKQVVSRQERLRTLK